MARGYGQWKRGSGAKLGNSYIPSREALNEANRPAREAAMRRRSPKSKTTQVAVAEEAVSEDAS